MVQYKINIQTINYLPPSAAYTRERHLHAQSTPYKLKQRQKLSELQGDISKEIYG